ncbi:MAG TPA: hypothetical protein VGG19_10400 [Tepidisphaeraceae bacterium]|jgi:hypothetical protein
MSVWKWIIIVIVVVAALGLRRYWSHYHDAAMVPAAYSVAETRDVASVFRSLEVRNSPIKSSSKQWIDDFAAFRINHPGHWIVGRSPDPCLSEDEAQRTARENAAQAVWTLVPARLRNAEDADALKRSLTAAIASGGLQADYLAERFDRPYGTVWTESVLLDASPQKLDSFLSGRERAWRKRQHLIAAIRSGAFILVAAAWLLYIFLNAVTKGYFTTRLRLGAAVVTAAAFVLFI